MKNYVMRNLWIAESRKQKFFSFDINPKLINSKFIKTFSSYFTALFIPNKPKRIS